MATTTEPAIPPITYGAMATKGFARFQVARQRVTGDHRRRVHVPARVPAPFDHHRHHVKPARERRDQRRGERAFGQTEEQEIRRDDGRLRRRRRRHPSRRHDRRDRALPRQILWVRSHHHHHRLERADVRQHRRARVRARPSRSRLAQHPLQRVHRRIVRRPSRQRLIRRREHDREVHEQQRERHRGVIVRERARADAVEDRPQIFSRERRLDVERRERAADDEGGREFERERRRSRRA